MLDAWRPRGNVHTLVTSRIGNWRLGVSPIEVDAWALAEALAYLVRETGRADLSETELSKLAETLGRLPLALSHAAAYLRRRKAVTIQDYLGDLDRHMSELPKDAEYQSPVYATFRAALRQAEQEAAGATALMSLAAFFAPDGIPEELFQQDAALYPPDLEPVVAKPAHLADTLGVLDDLSIIDFKPATRTFSTHRIVQAAARDALGPDRDAWAQRAIGIAFSAFPQPAPETWPQCARLVAHVRALNAHVPAEAATRELGWLLGTAGEYSRERAALADVLPLFRASHDIFERLATADPENGGSQRDLAVSHGKIGDMLRIQGNLPDALAAYKASLAIAERLATTGPENAVWQRDLSIANDYIGDVLRAQGNLSGALTAYKASLAIVDRLATADPGNAGWQRDLSVSQERIGDVLVEQSNLPDALVAYNASLAIRERLATADPGNAGWQRDLSVSHDKIGDVLVQKGNLTDALAAYKASHAIAERLATADPGNAGWQRDLSVSHSKIGDVLVQQGNLPDALAAYKASLAIAERLATADPGNAGWQRDVAISNERLGDIYLRQENSIEARQAFERALGAYEALITRNPSDVPSQVYSVLPRWRLSHLDPRNARRHLESALAILNPLAAAGRLDANRLGWIAEIEGELSEL